MIDTTNRRSRMITGTAAGDEHIATSYHDNAGTATGDTVVIINPILFIHETTDELKEAVEKFGDFFFDRPSFSMPEPDFDPLPAMPDIRKIEPAGKFLPHILNRRMGFPKSGFVKIAKKWR